MFGFKLFLHYKINYFNRINSFPIFFLILFDFSFLFFFSFSFSIFLYIYFSFYLFLFFFFFFIIFIFIFLYYFKSIFNFLLTAHLLVHQACCFRFSFSFSYCFLCPFFRLSVRLSVTSGKCLLRCAAAAAVYAVHSHCLL